MYNNMYERYCELVKWQAKVKQHKRRHMILFEGRDCAGKTSTIKEITHYLNPRQSKIIAIDKPTKAEQQQWYWQRFIANLPRPGEIQFWDRSYYNRAGVELVMDFCTKEQTEQFYKECKELERFWIQDGIVITKIWLSISKDEQKKRFKRRTKDPLDYGKMSEIDLHSQSKWDQYTKAKYDMFRETNTQYCQWHVVNGNDKDKCTKDVLDIVLSI